MSTDAIAALKDDHRVMRQLFRDFKAAGENATVTKGKLVKKIIEELTVHTFLENEFMYPEVRELMPELEDDILESYEEHHVVDVLCLAIRARRPNAATLALSPTLRTVVEAKLEERWFPQQISAWLLITYPDNKARCTCHTGGSTCLCSSKTAHSRNTGRVT
jgi:hypothetical protein